MYRLRRLMIYAFHTLTRHALDVYLVNKIADMVTFYSWW